MFPVMSEINLFTSFAPEYWHECDGSLLDLNSHSALYSLLDRYYGGDGRTSFGLPKLNASALVTGKGKQSLLFGISINGGYPMGVDMSGSVGTIKLYGPQMAHTVPRGWKYCDGQELSIADYPDLFKAIGTKYGGDGTTKFALPKLNAASLCATKYPPKFVIATKNMEDDDTFLSLITLFAGDTAPNGWAFCDGHEYKMEKESELFSLIGSSYGSDARAEYWTFALPTISTDAINEGSVAPKAIICLKGRYPSRPY